MSFNYILVELHDNIVELMTAHTFDELSKKM